MKRIKEIMKKQIIKDDYFNGHPLSPDAHGEGFNTNHLKAIDSCLKNALEEYSRGLVIITELNTPVDYGERGNQAFSNAMDYCQRKFKRQDWKPHYIAVREECNGHQHYHLVTVVDNSKVASPYRIQEDYAKEFERQLGFTDGANHGYMNDCTRDRFGNRQPNCYVVSRGDAKSYDAAFQRASYLAKAYSKPSAGRLLFRSQGDGHTKKN